MELRSRLDFEAKRSGEVADRYSGPGSSYDDRQPHSNIGDTPWTERDGPRREDDPVDHVGPVQLGSAIRGDRDLNNCPPCDPRARRRRVREPSRFPVRLFTNTGGVRDQMFEWSAGEKGSGERKQARRDPRTARRHQLAQSAGRCGHITGLFHSR